MRGGEGRRGERESKRERYESFFELIFFFLKQARKKTNEQETQSKKTKKEKKKKTLFSVSSLPPPPMRVLFSSRATAQLQGANRRRLSGDGERS